MAPKSNFPTGETFLQNLFSYFSYFAFDKAKEQAERERDASKNLASPVWIAFLNCISHLAAVEKLYMNLTLTPKGFLRKETSVRLTYEHILTELAEIGKKRANHSLSTSASSAASAGNVSPDKNDQAFSEGVLLHISSHLMLFIQARLSMLTFYERLINCSAGKYVNYEEMLALINEIIKKNSGSFHHPVLIAVKTTFMYESEIMSHLLGSLKAMQEWQFLPSLLHLHDAHSKLTSWQSLIQNKESKKYTFGSSFLKSSLPALYQWLWSAKSSFVSKFSLYFYQVLSNQAPQSETKNLITKLSCDYFGKIQTFQRKMDAQSVCIVLKGDGMTNLQTSGYCYPSSSGETTTGIESYLAIFANPMKPVDHWPSIVMQISDRTGEDLYDKAISIHDPKVGTTFIMCQIEPNLFLVTVFEGKKLEKENYIKDFIYDLALQLRCNKVFAALKPN